MVYKHNRESDWIRGLTNNQISGGLFYGLGAIKAKEDEDSFMRWL